MGAVNAKQDGTLLVDMAAFSPVTFSNNVVADCNTPGGSHAVFALYHNPEWATPFVPDDSVGISDYLGKRESDLFPYPAGTYLVKINFERGVSVVRKVVKS